MITWTCFGCFDTVEDHDDDGFGYCRGCEQLVDTNGAPVPGSKRRFAALRHPWETQATVAPEPIFNLPDLRCEFEPLTVARAHDRLMESVLAFLTTNVIGVQKIGGQNGW